MIFFPNAPATHKKARQSSRVERFDVCLHDSFLPVSPMTGSPDMTPSVMAPMAGHPSPSPVGRLGPVTAGMHITAVAHLPFFTDPHMSWTGAFGTDDYRFYRPYLYINLCTRRTSRERNPSDNQYQKSPLYQILFHLFSF
jgi:hypothetical protein